MQPRHVRVDRVQARHLRATGGRGQRAWSQQRALSPMLHVSAFFAWCMRGQEGVVRNVSSYPASRLSLVRAGSMDTPTIWYPVGPTSSNPLPFRTHPIVSSSRKVLVRKWHWCPRGIFDRTLNRSSPHQGPAVNSPHWYPGGLTQGTYRTGARNRNLPRWNQAVGRTRSCW